MNVRFGTASLLLAIAFAAISLGGVMALFRLGWLTGVETPFLFWLLLVLSPCWIPFAFLGYSIGRRSLTVKSVLVFAVAEAASIGLMLWADKPPV